MIGQSSAGSFEFLHSYDKTKLCKNFVKQRKEKIKKMRNQFMSINNKSIYFSSYLQRRIKNPAEHLKWSFFAKIIKAVNIFEKSSFVDVRLGFKYAFDLHLKMQL